ncbi:helix-turn-helix transcriptional regulator, AraC family [Geotalea daltonii FRC-32]|uniref:Helix-turn-helix transcriptional regulator, AraC family n=1 Tax=Geotalea daltonii (strain DSM 22248 / JCM 15807 / FRC-32) TaxID=316067 RepID=B9LZS6_GEODF|nr:helix-turn-helix transcriptional regulator [Geotalea daltonii]ACM18890.1 helix-turn-helix transcriptional regulator, AraC family [Geotalea daltonii FRC-32]
MQQFVHVGIVKLIVNGVSHLAPRTMGKRAALIEQIKRGDVQVIPAEKKVALLDDLLSECGAEPILNIGEHCNSSCDFPLFYFLLNSDSPKTLINKLENYYRYIHSAKRIRLDAAEPCSVTVSHVTALAQPISAAEDFFACGVLKTLLGLIGCRQLSYGWQKVGNPEIFQYLDDASLKGAVQARASQWKFQWESFSPPEKISGLDDFLLQKSKIVQRECLSDSVEAIVKQDLNHKWTLKSVAQSLNMSERSMQRKLQDEGQTFRKLLNNARIRTAESYLLNSQLSLTEIGYLTGFSDYSHFSKEFKRYSGTNPSQYRKGTEIACL